MPFALLNPYDRCFGDDREAEARSGARTNGPRWVRGSLHVHCQEHSGCSSVPLALSVTRYRDAGTAFLAVTDHDHVTDLSEERRRRPDMALLEGFEYSSDRNVLFIGERVPPLHRLPLQEALRGSDGLLTVVCHPRPRSSEDYWTADRILSLDPLPTAVEIYNGHYRGGHLLWRDTNPLATDVWDELLTRGVRLWGIACDDFHDPPDFGRAWTMACVDRITPRAALDAVAAGRCYGTTGLLLDRVEVRGREVEVRLAAAATGRFIGPGGRLLAEEAGMRFAWRHAGEAYARFEAAGEAGSIWLQPLFRQVP